MDIDPAKKALHGTAAFLFNIATAHGITLLSRTTRSFKETILALLQGHECTTSCADLIYTFSPRTKRLAELGAKEQQLAAILADLPFTPRTSDHLSGLHAPSPEVKRKVIATWQQRMSTENQRNSVCACCSRVFRAVTLKKTPLKSVNLSLLRNDDLPPNLHPRTYKFEIYSLKGQSHLQTKARTFDLCRECLTSLKRRKMPKYSLANWLYYGHDCLP